MRILSRVGVKIDGAFESVAARSQLAVVDRSVGIAWALFGRGESLPDRGLGGGITAGRINDIATWAMCRDSGKPGSARPARMSGPEALWIVPVKKKEFRVVQGDRGDAEQGRFKGISARAAKRRPQAFPDRKGVPPIHLVRGRSNNLPRGK